MWGIDFFRGAYRGVPPKPITPSHNSLPPLLVIVIDPYKKYIKCNNRDTDYPSLIPTNTYGEGDRPNLALHISKTRKLIKFFNINIGLQIQYKNQPYTPNLRIY